MDWCTLRELFDYDVELDRFRHKVSGRGKKINAVLKGSATSQGYLWIQVDGSKFAYHRMVFLWHHKYLPSIVDHKDRDKGNPAIWNLRDSTKSENERNTERSDNASHCCKTASGRWVSRFRYNGTRYYFGHFDTKEEASAASWLELNKLINS